MKTKVRKKNAVQLLRQVANECVKHDCALEFWNLITAMRGPDSDDLELKVLTTCLIRSAALPPGLYERFWIPTGAIIAANMPSSFELHRVRWHGYRAKGLSHFARHIQHAADVLMDANAYSKGK